MRRPVINSQLSRTGAVLAMAALLLLAVASSTGGAQTALLQAGSTASASLIARAASPTGTAATASAKTVAVPTLPSVTSSPDPTIPVGGPATLWTLDLFDKAGLRHENPDAAACTAASVQTSLNLIASHGGETQWSATTTYEMQETILAYERSNMTLPTTSIGSDPHGTRNALNYFGWGSMQAGVFVDAAYATFNAAAKAVVSSIARTHKPAIVFAWMGGHSQLVTGYQVRGKNPAVSDDYIVLGIYLTDPFVGTASLVYDGANHKINAIGADTWVALANWKSGPDAVQFSRYWQVDSTLTDAIDGRVGRREWYGKWVVVLATR